MYFFFFFSFFSQVFFVQQESTPPWLNGPSALKGLFLLLTRGANNSRPDYTAPRCPTELLRFSEVAKNRQFLDPFQRFIAQWLTVAHHVCA